MLESGTPTENQNPLLDGIRLPGETHTLPSGGIFYDKGELDPSVTNGEVHIYPMTTIDELIIRSPDKLFSGESVDEVFKRCIPAIKKPRELFAKDIDFLMVALRKVTYGDEFEVLYTHDCDNAEEHSYMIHMSEMIKKSKNLDPTKVIGQFTVTLENSQVVKLHPIRYQDVIAFMQELNTDKEFTDKEQEEQSIRTLLGIIESVNDITDDVLIAEWLRKIPAGWARKISNALDSTSNWGPDFTQKVVCKDCGKAVDLAAPMNPVSFFG